MTGDLRGSRQEGVAWPDLAIADGRRVSPADAYLLPALHRPNLTVLGGCLVTRLLIRDGRCAGAAYLRDGARQQAHASAEVIVCAGAIGSPQLLMLSGIGPAGAPARRSASTRWPTCPGPEPNLQDHPVAMACYASRRAAAREPVQPRGNATPRCPARWQAPGPTCSCFPILLPVAPPGLQAPRRRLRPGGLRDRPRQPRLGPAGLRQPGWTRR